MSDVKEQLDVMTNEDTRESEQQEAEGQCGTGCCSNRNDESLASLSTILANALQHQTVRNLEMRLAAAEAVLQQIVEDHNKQVNDALPFPEPLPPQPGDVGPVYIRLTLFQSDVEPTVRIETSVGCVDLSLDRIVLIQAIKRSEYDVATRVTLQGVGTHAARITVNPDDENAAAQQLYLEQHLQVYSQLLDQWHSRNDVETPQPRPVLLAKSGIVDELTQEDLVEADNAE